MREYDLPYDENLSRGLELLLSGGNGSLPDRGTEWREMFQWKGNWERSNLSYIKHTGGLVAAICFSLDAIVAIVAIVVQKRKNKSCPADLYTGAAGNERLTTRYVYNIVLLVERQNVFPKTAEIFVVDEYNMAADNNAWYNEVGGNSDDLITDEHL